MGGFNSIQSKPRWEASACERDSVYSSSTTNERHGAVCMYITHVCNSLRASCIHFIHSIESISPPLPLPFAQPASASPFIRCLMIMIMITYIYICIPSRFEHVVYFGRAGVRAAGLRLFERRGWVGTYVRAGSFVAWGAKGRTCGWSSLD